MKVAPLLLALPLCFAQAQDAGVPVRMIVTVETNHGAPAPKLTAADILVQENNTRARSTAWTPISAAGLQLWLVLDDSSDSTIGNQFSDLRAFIAAQPSSTQIGLGYMRNGTVLAAQPLTTDHASVAKAIRLPVGEPGISASPYTSLSDLIHKWPATERAREILMITSGIDLLYGPGPENPYLLRAIADAQRAGVVITSIYFGSAGHAGHSYWQMNWGQNDLSQLAYETGGEFYWQGLANPVSLGPFLDEFGRRLNNQFLLTFTAKPGTKAGLEPVKVRTEVPHISLVAAAEAYVPTAR